jgi:LytS/YehU family sensor histidine kinase
MKSMDAKQTAFVAMMSALGIALSLISLNLGPISIAVPGQGAAALDLSNIATFVAGIFGGAYMGAIVGFLSGIYAGYYFGYVVGGLGLLSLIGVPLGKALTGLTTGFLYRKLKVSSSSRPSALTVPIVLTSYIPECIFTIIYFVYIVPYFTGSAWWFMLPAVIPKAWIEIGIMSLLMAAITGNTGFREFIATLLHTPKPEKSFRK